MKKQLAWILGGASIVGLGMVASLSACSGDTNPGTDAGGKDSTAKDQSVDNNTQDTGTTDAGSDTSTADCGSSPTLHPAEAGAIFCGFLPDGGPSFSCTTGNQCCLGGKLGNVFADQKCETFGSVCDNPSPDASTSPGVPIECNQNSDCTANGLSNNVCCLQGASAPTVVSGCSYYKASLGTGIKCETANAGACSGGGDVQICSSTSDCPNGKTCTPMKWKLYQLGFCL